MATVDFMPHSSLENSSSDLLILILDKIHSGQTVDNIGEHSSVLTVRFDDIEYSEEPGEFISKEDAAKIVEGSRKASSIIASCHGGVSRSAAVALALYELGIAEPGGHSPLAPMFCPNEAVLRKIIGYGRSIGLKTRHSDRELESLLMENRRLHTSWLTEY